jgi:hypothetical protein
MALYTQSVVHVSRVGMSDVRFPAAQYGSFMPQYDTARQAIGKHMQPFAKNGWQVSGYHVLLDTERIVEERHFIWHKD